MTTQAQMQTRMLAIRAGLASGPVDIKTKLPKQLHNNLYKAARARGWKWSFAHDDKRVTVALDKRPNNQTR